MLREFPKWLFTTPDGHFGILFGLFAGACVGCALQIPHSFEAVGVLWPLVVLKLKS